MLERLFLSLSLLAWASPATAGTSVKAYLESLSRKNAWVKVEASIDQGRMRLDFEGPTANGELLYERDSSLLTLVDHLHKTILPLSAENQEAIKLLLTLFSGKLKDQASDPSARQVYQLATENAQAFFNGAPRLEKKDVTESGFTCDEYVTDLAGTKAREVWVTTPDKAGMNLEDYNTFRSLAHLAVEVGSPLLAQLGADMEGFQQNLADPQWPVFETLYYKGKASARYKVLSLHAQSFNDGVFQPPQRYQVLGLMDLLQEGHKGR